MDDIVEWVARAPCAADQRDPEELLTIFWDAPTVAWRLYVDDAKAAIRAVMEGVEPVAWKYEDDGDIWACAIEPEPIVWDEWTETPLYDLTALKEALK